MSLWLSVPVRYGVFLPDWGGMCAWALARFAAFLVVLVKNLFSDLHASEGIEVATLRTSGFFFPTTSREKDRYMFATFLLGFDDSAE